MYRVIDFKRDKDGVPAQVASIEYDPNRSANIALLHYADGEKRYIIAPAGLSVGHTIMSGSGAESSPGKRNDAGRHSGRPTDSTTSSCTPARVGSSCARPAFLPSSPLAKASTLSCSCHRASLRMVHIRCRATIGRVGNSDHQNVKLGKAGRKRHMGRRPSVRGTAMNPVDHPHGGGEGRTKGGRHPCSPTAVLAKGGRRRKKNHPTDKFIIRSRHKKKKSS